MTKTQKFQFIPFVICLAIPLIVGFIGSQLTMGSINGWYTTITKPSFNPPNWIFGPVWTTIFILMGIASYRVWTKRNQAKGFRSAVGIYLLQLVFNIMWSLIFFNLHQIGLAFVEIIILIMLVIANALIFYRFDKLAGWLFLPYLLWASFACYLNYIIFTLN